MFCIATGSFMGCLSASAAIGLQSCVGEAGCAPNGDQMSRDIQTNGIHNPPETILSRFTGTQKMNECLHEATLVLVIECPNLSQLLARSTNR